MRYTMLRVGGMHARHVDQISNYRRGGRFCARTATVVQRCAHRVALDQHGVHHAFHVGDQTLGRNQSWVHAQLNPLGDTLGNAEQFDAIAQLLGILNIFFGELGNALGVGLIKLHRNAKGDSRKNGELVRGIHAFNIKSRVGFGIAQALCLGQHGIKGQALVAHLGQNKICSAVDNASHPFDTICAQAFAHRLNDGDTAGHCRFKSDHHAFGLRSGENFIAMHGEQRLVSGHDMLAIRNGLEHQRFRLIDTADQLDYDIDLGVLHYLQGIGGDFDIFACI